MLLPMLLCLQAPDACTAAVRNSINWGTATSAYQVREEAAKGAAAQKQQQCQGRLVDLSHGHKSATCLHVHMIDTHLHLVGFDFIGALLLEDLLSAVLQLLRCWSDCVAVSACAAA
jgi:hypothetical protein